MVVAVVIVAVVSVVAAKIIAVEAVLHFQFFLHTIFDDTNVAHCTKSERTKSLSNVVIDVHNTILCCNVLMVNCNVNCMAEAGK